MSAYLDPRDERNERGDTQDGDEHREQDRLDTLATRAPATGGDPLRAFYAALGQTTRHIAEARALGVDHPGLDRAEEGVREAGRLMDDYRKDAA